MKFLYIIGSGSLHYNEELRYSLRSLEAFYPDAESVTVVGEDVGFLSDCVNFSPIKEADGNKEYRIAQKILTACENEFIQGDFVFMNDDFFFHKPIDLTLNYAKGELTPKGLENYQKAISDTKNYLQSLNKTTYHFDVHTPILYNSEKFIELKPHIQKSMLSSNGMVVKSLYGNIHGLTPTFITDCKLSTLQTPRDFERLKQGVVISCSDGAWSNGVRKYLKDKFPKKSKYEK